VRCRALRLLAAALLAACATTPLNYTDALGPRYAAGPVRAPRSGDTLKIVAFNIRYAIHIDRAIRLIQDTPELRDPDVLLLQEMDEAGAAAIAESLGLGYVYYPATVSPATRRDFGDAVLTRYPIADDRKVILPHLSRTRGTQREAVGATLLVNGRRLRVYSVHLATMVELGPGARRQQLAAVLADARRYPLVILGGDFNSGSVPEIALPQGFAWPTEHLGRTAAFWDLDHVLLKGLAVGGSPGVGLVHDVRGASDHRPVWATVVLPAADTVAAADPAADTGTALRAAPDTARVPGASGPAPAEPCTGDGINACVHRRPLQAVLEGLAFNVAVNRFDDWVRNAWNPREGYWARVGPDSWSRNLRLGWEWDTDEFSTNLFMHPVHGAVYFRSGRENGLDFWESVPLAFLGSAEWEYFGENARPSLNDFYNTSFGGVALGEMTYRLAALVRDDHSRGAVRILRELAALPLDPVGSLRRLLSGDLTRVAPGPIPREPGALALRLQGGARVAVDSGPLHRHSAASALVAELDYGDPFARPYREPFDVFSARVLIGAGGYPVNELRVTGRLYAHEFTNRSTAVRTFFTVQQRLEYAGNPAYKFAAQALDVGLSAGFTLHRGWDVRLEGFAEGIALGAVDAPGAGIQGTPRTYDFGPGVGIEAAASLRKRTFPLLTARWHGALVHSVSGSPADHYTQLPSLEAGIPLGRRLGIGAYAGWYVRRSSYAGAPREAASYPDYRVYLTWQTHRRPTAEEMP